MKIAILSDTHGFIDAQIIKHLSDADEIWHAGDIGHPTVIDELEKLPGRLRAVYGNIDSQVIRVRTSEDEHFKTGGSTILMTHIAGKPSNYNKRVRTLLRQKQPNILVCGHSHILKVENDRQNNVLFINPGACGHHGLHKIRTIIKFELKNGLPANMAVIELGKRGKLKT